jgi:putative transposase
LDLAPKEKAKLIDFNHPEISISKQAELLGVSRSTCYYLPKQDPLQKVLMDEIDKIYTQCPFYGKRRISNELRKIGYEVGVKRSRSLMELMGIEAIYPKPKTSLANAQHKKYPYLLKDKIIQKPNEVWSTDITYIRMKTGWIYLVAIIDWFSRYVLAWDTSITLENAFCISTLEEALEQDKPEIFNSDQGVQFTSNDFIFVLQNNDIQISMDGKGRCLDNIFIERFWRSLKYEEVYLKDYETVAEARKNLKNYFEFYNHKRPHQSLDYATPAEVYKNKK